MKPKFGLKSSMNIFLVLTLLLSVVAGTSFASSATKPFSGKNCLKSEVGKSLVYKASMGRSIYPSRVKSYLECTKYRGKFLWMSTITPKSFSFTKPSKDKVIITPTVAGTPAPMATNGSNDVAPSAPLPASDWSGFVAPKVTFSKMLSCVKSASKEVSPLTGALAYNFTIVEQLKLTGGHFNYEGKTYNPSDVLYVSYTPYTLSTNSMDLSMGMPDSAELYFSPFNWKTNGGGPAGGGVSDFGPDASYKMIDFPYIFHSTQAECDSLPKP